MQEEIVNRVALSKLIVIDLEDYYPVGQRILFDLSEWLHEGFVLREKEFRERIKTHDWEKYTDAFVAITCSSDAIVPTWAFTLVSLSMAPYAKVVISGNLIDLESSLYKDIINKIDIEPYKNKPIILKGCSNKPVPLNAYLGLANKLQPLVKSIMYGEACSAVPLYKKKN
ncbi:Protein of unknown function [Flavobacteriaceae bacterium MAR_2010_188]|nr:Protein of unknown function [Flavobacteriaceae bacterium MAR_2010_188]